MLDGHSHQVNRPDKIAPSSIDLIINENSLVNAKIKQIVFNGIIRTSVFELSNCFFALREFIHILTNKNLETFLKITMNFIFFKLIPTNVTLMLATH